MKIKLLHLYYDILNLYGENANIRAIYNNLKNSQCTFKILLTNDRKTDFNQVAVNDENTYIANTVEEVIEMLKFVSENKEFLDNKSSENNESYLF